LLSKEAPEHLSNTPSQDTWQQYLFNKIATHSWRELNFKELAVITFNYDRSFEHYMMSAIQHSYGVSKTQAYNKLAEMKIVHIYGSLGTCDPSDRKYYPYGNDNLTANHVDLAAQNLKVIPEGRDDDATLCTAREILLASANIAFLGFGFDKTNLERLHSTETCTQTIDIDGIQTRRRIAATTYGMTTAESVTAAKATYNLSVDEYIVTIGSDFKNMNCIELLRETLILDQFSV
jgi:hypothetical protein